jgi:catechol 2,3-dioxygenase-like lactoylglutathione lyase family enzyme
MEQRISLVTLGVADLARARAFYEALGWRGAKQPDDEWSSGCGPRSAATVLPGSS